jgi:ribonuclease HII
MAVWEWHDAPQENTMHPVSLISWQVEEKLWKHGYTHIAGIDEAGRGALAGPVVAAAVICRPGVTIANVDDSKRLTPAERDELYDAIRKVAMGMGVGFIEASVIDRINIRQATLLAMQAAVQNLACQPDFLLVDGRDRVPVNQPQRMVVRGDQTVGSIAAASIVAKVSRDRYMEALDGQFQGYGLAQHKGYGTVTHMRAIQQLGPTMIHRVTFRGVVQTVSRYD